MARTMSKVLGTIAIAVILASLVGTIVSAETTAAARSEKWRCNRLTCRQYSKNYSRTGRFVVYGTVIHVTARTKNWLRSDLNSSVARVNYLKSQFSYVRTD